MIKKIICWLVIIIFLISTLGCYSYKMVPDDELKENKLDGPVRITTKDYMVIELVKVTIQYPKLVGFTQSDSRLLGERIELSFDNIEKVEYKELNTGNTLLVFLGIVVVGSAASVGFFYLYLIAIGD